MAARLLAVIPVLLGVTIIVFIISRSTPGDPLAYALGENASPEVVAEARRQLGLDAPLHIQYFNWLKGAVRGDLGNSMIDGRPVMPTMLSKLPATLQLAAMSLLFAVVIGIPMGVLAASRPDSVFDNLSRFIALLGLSFPSFWWSLILILFVGYHLGWLPLSGYGSWQQLILPSLALGMRKIALVMRLTRSSLLNVVQEDYVRTAYAKGLRQRIVLTRHALPNALIPILTVLGAEVGDAIAGATIIETIFAWPGVGRYTYDALIRRDYPAIMGAVVLFAWVFVLINMLVDLLYTRLDPRIRVS